MKAGTGRRYTPYLLLSHGYITLLRFLGNCLNACTNCYTLEVSFFSYATGSNQVQEPYTEQACILTVSVVGTMYLRPAIITVSLRAQE